MNHCISALESIAYLTQRSILNVNENQSNRYCILLNTKDGNEAFYFSTPIYNNVSRRLVRRNFAVFNNCYQFIGSNCTVQVTNTKLLFIKEHKTVGLDFGQNIVWDLNNGCLISDDISIIPSYNGVLIEGDIRKMVFNIKMNFDYSNVRNSHNCICFMESKFRPIFVVSALKTQPYNNAACSPLFVNLNTVSRSTGGLSFYSSDLTVTRGAIEMNFYESKLIQDTPVSVKYPNENNAFGPIGFIGKSDLYGTQWLYSRLDINKMPELQNKFIRSIKMYVPKFNSSSMPLDMIELSNRFCSFGSNWSNKVQAGDKKHTIIDQGEYICIDMTDLYINRGRLNEAAGMVIVPANSGAHGYKTISTGDSYSAPPIICVKYTNL